MCARCPAGLVLVASYSNVYATMAQKRSLAEHCCMHRFFHKYEQTPTEKFVHTLLPILMRERDLQRLTVLSKYSRLIQKVKVQFRF